MKPPSILLMACALLGVSRVDAADYSGEALLVVYPDYPINTDTFYGYTRQAGHAGVLLIKEDGLTKYYEFGRYDAAELGTVRQKTIPNVKILDGRATEESLKKVLRVLSKESGKGGRVLAAYFINMDFTAMNAFAEARKHQSDPHGGEYDPSRKKYSFDKYNCGHFAESVILKGNAKVDRPTILDFRPNNIVDEYIEEKNAKVLFDPKTGELTIGKGDESDAKRQ